MKEVINIYKSTGETPLEAIKKFKEKKPAYKNVKMTYAGRLDPLAEGVLILLAGKAVYRKNEFLKLDKKYEAEILCGFATDTGDILGIVSPVKNKIRITQKKLNKFKGEFIFSLPAYSSYKIKGKPIHWWAREGKLEEIEIPKRKTEIYDLKFVSRRFVKKSALKKSIFEKIDAVSGDFRQREIKERWEEILGKLPASRDFEIVRIKVFCSSGTYVRELARLFSGAVFGLKRTAVEEFILKDSLRIATPLAVYGKKTRKL